MLEIWKTTGQLVLGWVGFSLVVCLFWSIGLFFHRVWQAVNQQEIGSYTFKQIWKTWIYWCVAYLGIGIISGIVFSVGLFFFKSWEHINTKPEPTTVTFNNVEFSSVRVGREENKLLIEPIKQNPILDLTCIDWDVKAVNITEPK